MEHGDSLPVVFAGLPERRAVQTWGQVHTYSRILARGDEGHWYTVTRDIPLDPDVRPERISQAVRLLLSTHEGLRSRYGPDGDGTLAQDVRPAGRITIPVVDEDVVDTAEWKSRLRVELHDPAHDLPVAFLLVTRAGTPRHLHIAASHVVVDAWAMNLVVRDVERFLAGGSGDPTATRYQPVDRAHYETSEVGEAVHLRSSSYWRSRTEGRDWQLPAAGTPRTPRFWRGSLVSPDLPEALPRLVRRTGCNAGAVLLAATTKVFGEALGLDVVPMRSLFSNRTTAKLRDGVMPLAQWGLLPLAADEGPVEETVLRVRDVAIRAYASAQYDPLRMAPLTERLPKTYYNYLHEPLQGPREPGRDGGRPSRFTWRSKWHRNEPGLCSLTWLDNGNDLEVAVDVDTALLTPDAAEAMLRSVEAMLAAAASRSG